MKANEKNEMQKHIALKNKQLQNNRIQKELPSFLRNSEETVREDLNLTADDLKALRDSLISLKKDEALLHKQIVHTVKWERKERDRKSSMGAKQELIQKELHRRTMEREAIVKKKQEDIADNNEQSWLKVQRTFLNKWIDTSLKIELKEERAKSVQKQNEMLTTSSSSSSAEVLATPHTPPMGPMFVTPNGPGQPLDLRADSNARWMKAPWIGLWNKSASRAPWSV